MKKIIIALLVLGTICANTFAQEYDVVEVGEESKIAFTNEAYLTVGTPSFVGLFAGMFGAIAQGLADAANGENGEENKKNESVVALSAGYNHYFLNNTLGVGGMITYEKFSIINLLTIQAKLTAQYGWEHFKFYHALSGGVLFVPGSGKPSFAFDITALGLKLDFDRWNVFIEASGPTSAIIKAGGSFKF